MNKIMNKKILKRIIALLIIIAMSMTCVGCGFAGPDNSAKKGKIKKDEGAPDGTNKLLTVWDNTVTSCDTNGNTTEDIGAVQLKARNVNYGSNIGASNSITIARDVAIFMYGTVFPSAYPTDNFSGNFDLGSGMELQPGEVVSHVSNITAGALGSDGALNAVISAVEGFAAAIFIMLWAVGFLSQVVNEKFTMETLLKSLMQLISGILLVRNVGPIASAFAEAGDGLLGLVSGNGTGATFSDFEIFVKDTLENGITSISLGFSLSELNIFQVGICTFWIDWGSLVAVALMAIPLYAQVMCAYKIVSIMIMRTLELSARIALAPIPVAFSAQNGFTPESLRYFRGLLACAMQPVLIIIGAACFDQIGTMVLQIFGRSGGAFSCLLAMVVSYFVLSAYIGETKHLAHEIIAR